MLLWFRNDLRTHDNPALDYFLQHIKPGAPRKAIFFISEQQWYADDWSLLKIDLIKRHAHALVTELTGLDIELALVKVDSFHSQVTYLTQYCRRHGYNNIIANSALEYNERQRDAHLSQKGITLTLFESDVIVPKGKLLTKSGTMFKKFTPFKKAWLKYVKEQGYGYVGKPKNNCYFNNFLCNVNRNKKISHRWPLASLYEQHSIQFITHKLTDYAEKRDYPSADATSSISPYLANGLISPRYILTVLLNHYPDLLIATDSNEFAWLNELIWREFYRHLIFHHPRLCHQQCFQEKYQKLPWHNNSAYFQAWYQGKTGYPIIDAAMRQLNQTGWMHNRLRMLVASFLTKHLLIDWRLGEQYFMQHLIDGDFASNNGGWQWSASTGCDAQPYFRIFNPIKQSEKFDKNGDFIRQYLPELNDIPNKYIHFPHDYIAEKNLRCYWPAIVEHNAARIKAIAFFKQV